MRGDPFLWQYLKEYYNTVSLPYPVERLERDIIVAYERFAGEPPALGKVHEVREFSKTHGGMSTGMLSGDFWLDTAIPLLLERLKKIDQQRIVDA